MSYSLEEFWKQRKFKCCGEFGEFKELICPLRDTCTKYKTEGKRELQMPYINNKCAFYTESKSELKPKSK